MQSLTIEDGTRQVVATRNDSESKWEARVYVNRGETATLETGKFKTETGVRRWASKKIGK